MIIIKIKDQPYIDEFQIFLRSQENRYICARDRDLIGRGRVEKEAGEYGALASRYGSDDWRVRRLGR